MDLGSDSPFSNWSNLRMQILLKSDADNLLQETVSSSTILCLSLVGICCNLIGFLGSFNYLLKECRLTIQLNCFLSFAQIIFALGPTIRNSILLWRQYSIGHRIMAVNACSQVLSIELASVVFTVDAYLLVAIRFVVLFVFDDRPLRKKAVNLAISIAGTSFCFVHSSLEGYFEGTLDRGSGFIRCSLLSGTFRLSSMRWKTTMGIMYATIVPLYLILYLWLMHRTRATRRISNPRDEHLFNLLMETSFGVYVFSALTLACLETNLIIFSTVYSRFRGLASFQSKMLLRFLRIIPQMAGFLHFLAFMFNCNQFKTAVRQFLRHKVEMPAVNSAHHRLSILNSRISDGSVVQVMPKRPETISGAGRRF